MTPLSAIRTILLSLLILPGILTAGESNNSSSNAISLSTEQLPSFRQVYAHTVSEVQFYYLSSQDYSGPITIEAEYPLQVSLHCFDNFSPELQFDVSNSAGSTKIFVRSFPESTGSFSPVISHTWGGDSEVELSTALESITTGIPEGYYSAATSSGSTLKTQLHHIINHHNAQSYASLWTHFLVTDATFEGFVWDMYSDVPCQEPPYIYTFGEDQDSGTGGNQEADVYNREHSMPRSWFGGNERPMDEDLYHIYPVDKYVNAVRANYPYGVVDNPQQVFLNGAHMGTNTAGETYSGPAYEPIDAYKGDLARAFLYMITRYEDRIESWTHSDDGGNQMLDHQKYPGFQPWVIDMFLEWHRMDPVSHKERMRNDQVYLIQGNRNPFVDHPEFVEKIWGDTTLSVNNFHQRSTFKVFPNPAQHIVMFSAEDLVKEIQVYTVDGRLLFIKQPQSNTGNINMGTFQPGIYVFRFRTLHSSGHRLLHLLP